MKSEPRRRVFLAAYAAFLFLSACAAARVSPQPSEAPTLQGAVAAGADGGMPTTLPMTAPAQDQDGAGIIRELLDRKPLRFATDDRDGPRRFHFFVSVKRAGADGRLQTSRVLVVRDGPRVGLLCMSADGLPYAYMTRGLLVTVDRAKPGGLLVHAAGAPSFVLAADEDRHGLIFELSHRGAAAEPRVVLDLSSLLRVTLAKLKEARFDPARRTVVARTENSTGVVSLPDERDATAPPVTGFMSTGADGTSVSVVSLSLTGPLPFDPARVDAAAAVLRIGLPVRPLTPAGARALDLFAPPDLGADPRERRAAHALGRLLTGEPPPPPRRPNRVEQISWGDTDSDIQCRGAGTAREAGSVPRAAAPPIRRVQRKREQVESRTS